MILLDTDHLSILSGSASDQRLILLSKLQEFPESEVATNAVSVEEQCRGWLAEINKNVDVEKQLGAYASFVNLIKFLASWKILPFTADAAAHFKTLRRDGVRIGSNDLKIASITITQKSLLLSANLRDFRKVPNLRVEDWLH
jgi:tRNA(fMet)-specific endonuclease VapC